MALQVKVIDLLYNQAGHGILCHGSQGVGFKLALQFASQEIMRHGSQGDSYRLTLQLGWPGNHAPRLSWC